MSTLIVQVRPIDKILPHPNADKLEILQVEGWNIIEKKGIYREGDLTLFVPPDAVLPQSMVDSYGVANYLAKGNRVKAVKLRGENSFGLCLKPRPEWSVGKNIAGELGITKWEPPVVGSSKFGSSMKSSQAKPHPMWRKYTEIEHLRNYSRIIPEGTEVICLEKNDGANFSISSFNGELVVASRNFCRNEPTKVVIANDRLRSTIRHYADRWFGLKLFQPKFVPDPALRSKDWWWHPTLDENFMQMLNVLAERYNQVTIYGESYGPVQPRMTYGSPDQLKYVVFDISVDGKFLHIEDTLFLCNKYRVPSVPVIWRGPYNFDTIQKLADGMTLMGPSNQVREGIICRPILESRDPKVGRLIFKVINTDFLMKKYTKEAEVEGDGDFKDE